MIRERLIEYHLLQLKQGTNAARLDSIEQLVLLEAIEALDALGECVKNNEDVEVRRAAQQAGRHLFKLSLEQKSRL